MDFFKFVITIDEVENVNPYLEIYLWMKNKLNVVSNECIVTDDSAAGIKAGLSANMNVFAVTNSIIRDSVYKSKLLVEKFIVDNHSELKKSIYDFIECQK